MTVFSDPVLHEVLDCYRAWQDLVRRVMPPCTDPIDVDPLKVHEALMELPNDACQRQRCLASPTRPVIVSETR